MAGMDSTKTVVMPNCVSLNEFRALDPNEILAEKKRLGLSSDSKIVGTVTRLYDSKGNRYVLEAAVQVLAFFPSTTFLIVGDGPLRHDLEKLSKTLGIDDRVVFTGVRKDVRRLLAIFDVMVFASWTAEGTPLSVLEAMAMGKAIVATDIVEILEDGVTGLLVPPKDSRAIGRCVISCLRDEDLAKRLGKNAKEESQKYSVDSYVSKLQSIYDQVVRRIKK
jgi:glycosyltransferase involved in cell wall biosynthesis